MSSKFYYLNVDKETFEIVKKYLRDIRKHIDLFKEDNKIQGKCMKEYQKKVGIENSSNWGFKYGTEKRLYLNACKELAILYLASEKLFNMKIKCNYKNFRAFVKFLNSDEIKKYILDKIY